MTQNTIELFENFLNNKLDNPFQLFGLFCEGSKKIIRFYLPSHFLGEIEIQGQKVAARKIDPRGLFICEVPSSTKSLDYKIIYPFQTMYDPYVFVPNLQEESQRDFLDGKYYELYKLLGAHVCVREDIVGTRFRVWAPNASKVTLVGDFNDWDGRIFPLAKYSLSGIWEIFIPMMCEGKKYMFEVFDGQSHRHIKIDPLAFSFERRPYIASIVSKFNDFSWEDQSWIKLRENVHSQNAPINIYELHLGSWMKIGEEEFANYRHLAIELAKYCKNMNFTHVELLPIMEHPLDESWGYQITGYFAPSSRYGTLQDFQYFINYLHKENIGVILDWVSGHFPKDDFALNFFDGTPLYEDKNPLMASHPHWETSIFDFKSKIVQNFLLSSALFWLCEMHIDGLRVDAVASMLYLDYGREKNWKPNKNGENLNLEAIDFLKNFNKIAHEKCPHILTIAEDSSTFAHVTKKVEEGGLGFDMKWKMGWMNDSLSYFSTKPEFRKHRHTQLTFSMWYAYTENFLLPLSHDEVVHEKKSLLMKLHAPLQVQFANVRLLYSYMLCHPGKKLLFMGSELGQVAEWDCKGYISWDLLGHPLHSGLHAMIRDMNHLYLHQQPLYQNDIDPLGFTWIEVENAENSIISYIRSAQNSQCVCIHNCRNIEYLEYFVPCRLVRKPELIFNSDALKYGGSGKIDTHVKKHQEGGFSVDLPPMTTVIFEL